MENTLFWAPWIVWNREIFQDITCRNAFWSPARLSRRRTPGKGPTIRRTLQPRRWRGRARPLPQSGLYGRPPRRPGQNAWTQLLGCYLQTCTPCNGMASCTQSSVVSCHCLHWPVKRKSAHIVWFVAHSCRQLYLVDSTCPMEAYILPFRKVSPWCKRWSCRQDLLCKVFYQGWVFCVSSR